MTAASAEESLVAPVLAEGRAGRLAQRGSEPIGVIDVRRPQQHYALMAGWFGQRLPLLNRLLARYHDGGEDGAGTGDFVYRATPAFPPGLPTDLTPAKAYSPAVSVARPIPVVSTAVAGNDRLSSADTVSSSADAVSSTSTALTEATPSAVARQAGLTPSSGAHFGRVGIAHLAPAAITGHVSLTPSPAAHFGRVSIAHLVPAAITSHDHPFGQSEEPGLRFASRGAIMIFENLIRYDSCGLIPDYLVENHNCAPTPAPSRLRHSITSTVATVSAKPLPERLAQRGSEPLGVIDAHQPQQHYSRAAGWLGQRLPLLNPLLTRYHDGGEHGVGTGGFTYRATSSFPPDLPNATGASSDLTRIVTTRVDQPANLTPAGNVSLGTVGIAYPTPAAALTPAGNVSPGTVGIAHPTSAADPTPAGRVSLGRMGIAYRTPAVIATAAGTELPAGTTATVARPTDLASSVAAPVESGAASSAMTLRVRRQAPPLVDAVSTLIGKTLTETTADGHAGPTARIPNQPVQSSPLPSNEVMENRPAAILPLATGLQTPLPVQPRSMAQPLAGARPITETKRLPEPQPTTIGLEPVIARKAVDAVSSASNARDDAKALATALPTPMPLARRTAAVPLSESITETADTLALPLILEKPAAAAPVPGLVWRKSIVTPTTGGAGNSGMIDATSAMTVATYPADGGMISTASPIMRAESTNPPAGNQPGASSPASMPARATALDWESLFDQFSRRLLRQLAIERERRGGKGWS